MTSTSISIPLIPTFRYRDAPAAIEFLCAGFGFEKHAVYPDDTGGIAHAQLSFCNGRGMIMLSSVRENEWDAYVKTPRELGANTCSVYVIVEDVDGHYEQAKRLGAEIVMAPKDEEYGGRGYGCKDPEGYVWYFGSYNPLAPA